MRKIKLILITVVSILVIFIFYLYFFLPIPDFSNKEVVKKINDGQTTIEWKKIVGVLEQNYTNLIIVRQGKNVDTICDAYNIADLKLNKNIIIIGFYGRPNKYKVNLPLNVLNYRIKIDTTYTK